MADEDINVDRLIEAVRLRRPIWCVRDPHHFNKTVLEHCWVEVLHLFPGATSKYSGKWSVNVGVRLSGNVSDSELGF